MGVVGGMDGKGDVATLLTGLRSLDNNNTNSTAARARLQHDDMGTELHELAVSGPFSRPNLIQASRAESRQLHIFAITLLFSSQPTCRDVKRLSYALSTYALYSWKWGV